MFNEVVINHQNKIKNCKLESISPMLPVIILSLIKLISSSKSDNHVKMVLTIIKLSIIKQPHTTTKLYR